MNPLRWRILLGAGLILAGLFSLLDAFGWMRVGEYGWGLLFLAVGAAFLYVLFTNSRSNWWAAIPGFTLLGIGLLILVSAVSPRFGDLIGGAIVTGFIALAFLLVYLIMPGFWWALIPAGVMFSVALTALIDPFVRFDIGWVFMLGMAATFAVIAYVPKVNGKRLDWALWPAGVLLVIAIIMMIAEVKIAGYIWPVLLIIGGGFLLWRAYRGSPSLPQ